MKQAKIVLAGLDNAGKSSLLVALDKKFGIEPDLQQLKPTIRIARDTFTFLSQTIFKWDFGGQEKYREEYLSRRDRYFSDIDLLIFVVDVQDRDRFGESLEYFQDILAWFKQNELALPVSVFLHKYDPKLREQAHTEKSLLSLKELFSHAKQGFHVDFYETSVDDIFSVIRAFSRSFTRLFKKTELISAYFEEIAASISAVTLLLYDQSGLTIGEYYRPHLDPWQRKRVLELYVDALELLESTAGKRQQAISEQLGDEPVSGVIQKLQLNNQDFTFLLLMSQPPGSLDETFQGILPKLKRIIRDVMAA